MNNLELNVDIQKKFRGFALNVNFKAGTDALGLLGASGAGKSMTLRCIAGIAKPDRGKIVLNGRVLFDSKKGITLPARERKIGFLFQNYALFPHMTVEENIAFGLDKLTKKQRLDAVLEMITMIKLEGLEKRYPYQLSGGQQQRVALARALAIKPEVLLLDEPFSALDDYLRVQMIKSLIDTIDRYHGITIMVAHNMEEIYRMCSQLVVLAEGRVEAQGVKQVIFSQPPSLMTAQVTGCRNYSAARFLSSREFDAVDWGIKLKANEELVPEIRHVAIRAHYISPADKTDRENIFHCWPSFINESPFRATVYLTLERRPEDPEDYHLQWEMLREQWLALKYLPLPWRICLKPERLILMNH